MKLINNDIYLLLIDEEAEINTLDAVINLHNNELHFALEECLHKDNNCKKVTAYYPLTKEAKELDLFLLPPFEENFTKLNKLIKEEQDFWYNKTGSKTATEIVESCISIGYKAAQQSNKQFSLEDTKNIIKWLNKNYSKVEDELFKPYVGREGEVPEDFFKNAYEEALNRGIQIQSLSTQQLPKEFIPEYSYIEYYRGAGNLIRENILKTITNSEGKEELVGIYKY